MLSILSITIPVYLLIGLGYLAARRDWFAPAEMRVFGRFVIQFALPALVFQALAQRPFSEILNGRYLFAYAAGSLLVLLGGWFVARRVRGRGAAFSALFGMGMGFSNSGFVGYPIALQVLGPTAAVALALCMLVENVLLLPLTLALAEGNTAAHAWHGVLRQTLVRLAKNPLILAIAAGLAVSLLGLEIPAPVAKGVGLLAGASTALALFVIGGSLKGLQLRGQLRGVGVVALGKLLLHPLAVLALVHLVPVPEPLRTAAVLFAAMPMLSIYPILAQPHGEETFCAAALLLATVLSLLTVSLWVGFLAAGLG
ncbi:MAG: AEC family transporter [Acidovorax sp.]